MMLFHLVGLDTSEIVRHLLARNGQDLRMLLGLRAWQEDPPLFRKAWLEWVKERFRSKEFSMVEACRFSVLRGLRGRGQWPEANSLAQDTWRLAGEFDCKSEASAWDWERFNPIGAIKNGDFITAKQLSEREMEERGLRCGGPWAIAIAAALGEPTPEQLVEAVNAGGVEAVDEYGMFGWYLLAREAAARGDRNQAFPALRNALSYWANAPFFYMNIWEKDTRWGVLAADPEFMRAFADKRRQIGPIYGTLHYFPGW